MVRIEEIIPRKLSGVSSLLVTFKYDPEVVETLKSFSTFYYHKKDFAWELPLSSLSDLLDKMSLIADVELVLMSDRKIRGPFDYPLTDDEKSQFKWKPFPHQIDAINYTLDKHKILLLDEMGLGKTNEMIWTAEALKRRGMLEHCLIICGVNSLKQNWKKEIAKYSTESAIVIGEKKKKNGEISPNPTSLKERALQLKNKINEFFIILNVEALRDDKIIEAIQKSTNNIGMICVDEAHKIATKTSSQGANLLKLKADYKIAATGTLLTNSPLSCYVPLVWTENDHSILTTFKSQYCVFGGFHDSQIIGYKDLDLLRDELQTCMLRRTKDIVAPNLPPKTVTYEVIEMSEEHRKFYDAIKDGIKEEADKIELNASNLLALTTRLRQATSAPSVLTSNPIMSSKLERCAEIVEDLVENGEKVVILSTFVEPVYSLAKLLDKYKPTINTGDQSDESVFKNVVNFQEGNDKVFIGTYGKVGTGHTLNAAAYMICIDTPYTYAQFSQGTDRIHRINNDRPAFITVLACKDTIDERVIEIIESKKELSDFVVDGIENSVSESLNDELTRILRTL